jgi:hypothetical protein
VGLKTALAEQLLLRTIWHLHLAGYEAGRQRNPSGAISVDKLTVLANGSWMAVDIYTNFDVPGVPLGVIWWPVTGPNHVPAGGIPDSSSLPTRSLVRRRAPFAWLARSLA